MCLRSLVAASRAAPNTKPHDTEVIDNVSNASFGVRPQEPMAITTQGLYTVVVNTPRRGAINNVMDRKGLFA